MSTPTIVERLPTPIPPKGGINDDCYEYSGSFLNEDCEALLSNLNIDTKDDVSDHTVRARKSSKSRSGDDSVKGKRVARPLRRYSSHSNLETKSQFGDGNDHLRLLQKHLQLQNTPEGTPQGKPWKIRRVGTAPCLFRRKGFQSPSSPRFLWFPGTLSNISTTDVSRRANYTTHRIYGPKVDGTTPLKTCLKQKSKSTASTLPVGLNGKEYSHETLSLRKVKTVDFKRPMRRQSLPPLKLWAYDSSTITRPTEDLYVVKPSCLPGSNIRSRIADAAITRTDVHVTALSPSRPGIDAPNNESAQRQLATPAMQVVESGNGMYEAVRDDESFENSDSGREPIAGEVSEATSASFFGILIARLRTTTISSSHL